MKYLYKTIYAFKQSPRRCTKSISLRFQEKSNAFRNISDERYKSKHDFNEVQSDFINYLEISVSFFHKAHIFLFSHYKLTAKNVLL